MVELQCVWGSENQHLIWKASRWELFRGKEHEPGKEPVQGHGHRKGERKPEVRDHPTEQSTRGRFFDWLKICRCLRGEVKGAFLLWDGGTGLERTRHGEVGSTG